MSRMIYTTAYEDILNKLETSTNRNFDNKAFANRIIRTSFEIHDKKYGKLVVNVRNAYTEGRLIQKMKDDGVVNSTKEQTRAYMNLLLICGILFSAQDIIIYRILLSHYINYQVNGIATITLDMIHNKYRGKSFMYKDKANRYDGKTLTAYANSLRKLTNMELFIQFGESKRKSFQHLIYSGKYNFVHKLLILENNSSLKNITTDTISYSLGNFGKYILESKQYSQLMPEELYKLRFNQIDTFNIGTYITRMIFLNRRGRTSLTIYVSTLLSRFNKYNRQGFSTSLTYLEYLGSLKDSVKRNKKIKHIKEQLDYVLDLLVKEEKIKKYQYTGKFNYKFIKDEELAIKITFKSKR